MLLNEAKFLSPKFMGVRWVLTTISIFIMGFVTSMLIKKEDIPADDTKEKSGNIGLNISSEYCIGCGVCKRISPEHFEIVDRKATVVSQDISGGKKKAIDEAIEKCPPKAIKYVDFSRK